LGRTVRHSEIAIRPGDIIVPKTHEARSNQRGAWLQADGDSDPGGTVRQGVTPVSLVHHGVGWKNVVESTRAIRAQRDLRLSATRLETPVPLMSHSDNQRPWPVPARPWAMRMRWCDLLFAHWRVEAAAPPSGCPAPVGADMPTRMPDSEIHSADDWDRSGCWTDGDFTAGSSRIQ